MGVSGSVAQPSQQKSKASPPPACSSLSSTTSTTSTTSTSSTSSCTALQLVEKFDPNLPLQGDKPALNPAHAFWVVEDLGGPKPQVVGVEAKDVLDSFHLPREFERAVRAVTPLPPPVTDLVLSYAMKRSPGEIVRSGLRALIQHVPKTNPMEKRDNFYSGADRWLASLPDGNCAYLLLMMNGMTEFASLASGTASKTSPKLSMVSQKKVRDPLDAEQTCFETQASWVWELDHRAGRGVQTCSWEKGLDWAVDELVKIINEKWTTRISEERSGRRTCRSCWASCPALVISKLSEDQVLIRTRSQSDNGSIEFVMHYTEDVSWVVRPSDGALLQVGFRDTSMFL